MNKSLLRLWGFFDQERRRKFYILIAVMVFASTVEIFSIGAVIPFLAVLTDPQRVFQYKELGGILAALGFTDSSQIILPITILFITLSIFACCIRLMLLRLNSKFIFDIGQFLGCHVFNKIINQPFELHITRNSSEIISLLSVKINSVIYSIVMTSINIISASIMLFFILFGLLYINFLVTACSIIFFGVFYFGAVSLSKRKLYSNSVIINKATTDIVKVMQESVGGIRDILIDKSQETFNEKFRINNKKLRAAQSTNSFISSSPRFVVEGIGIIVIATSAYILSGGNNEANVIPILGLLALSAQKILPLLQQIYASTTEFKGNTNSLNEINEVLSYKLVNTKSMRLDHDNIDFNDEIKFINASYSYPNGTVNVLTDLNITIKKGDRIGVIGQTGSGKSTFLDLLMGLLNTSFGAFTVDGKRIDNKNSNMWQDHIAHVPQFIYLIDGTVFENIAFGVERENIDFERIKKVCAISMLEDVVNGLTDGLNAQVGERGVNLSGGQIQRIGIARALYKNSNVIIFDEATSSLDESTESKIMENIYSMNEKITLIMVSHRPSTLNKCNRIFSVVKGRIVEKTK